MNDKLTRSSLYGLEPGDDLNTAVAKHFEEKGRHHRLRLEEQRVRQQSLAAQALIANLNMHVVPHKRTKADIERREAKRMARDDHGDE